MCIRDRFNLKDFLIKIVPNTSSFLSFNISGNNHLNSARDWFENKLEFMFPIYEFKDIAYILSKKEEYQTLTNNLLKLSNTGVNKIKISKIPIEQYLGVEKNDTINHISKILENKEYHPFKDDYQNYCTAVKDENNKINVLKMECIHISNNNEEIPFELDEESRGTIALLHLIPALVLSYGEGVNYCLLYTSRCV